MVEEVAIVCDLSGSMLECGKRFIMRTVLRSVDQYYQMLNPSADLRLFAWRSSLVETPWSPGENAPEDFMDCKGSSEVRALIDEFGDCPDVPILILTDGYWDGSESEFRQWADSLDADWLRVVLLGADANKKLKTSYVFGADSLLAALEKFGG